MPATVPPGDQPDLSPLSRQFTQVTAAAYAVLGAVLFLMPQWSSNHFFWKASPFVAMSIGAWYLGLAAATVVAVKSRSWSAAQAVYLELWLFAFLAAAVLIAFRRVLRWDQPLAFPYAAVTALAVISALVNLVGLIWRRPRWASEGGRVPAWLRTLVVVFVAAVLYLGVRGMLAQPGGAATEGRIFPEPLTLLSVRGFAALYLAISLSAVPLLWTRERRPILVYAQAGLPLAAVITVAALFHWEKFDFVERPGGLVYLGAYLGVLGVTLPLVAYFKAEMRP